jgi:hypothetical protein
MLKTKGLPS